jgi:inorganic triphosphatase YgiF
MGSELELRLAVPDAAVNDLAAWLTALPGARHQPLQATYFDTASRQLGRAGWGLRLRREGQAWVQTMKGPLQADGLTRPEHNVPRAPDGPMPPLDAQAHAADPLAAAALAVLSEPLQPVFGTEIDRLRVTTTLAQGCCIELALDRGWLNAAGQRAAVQELELEWLSGPLAPLFDEALRWVHSHALVLEPRSKAARGQALATGQGVLAASSTPSATAAELLRWRSSATKAQ